MTTQAPGTDVGGGFRVGEQKALDLRSTEPSFHPSLFQVSTRTETEFDVEIFKRKLVLRSYPRVTTTHFYDVTFLRRRCLFTTLPFLRCRRFYLTHRRTTATVIHQRWDNS